MAKSRKLTLRVPEDVLPGVYANQLVIRHTREEFVLDFVSLFPPRGVVAARLIVSPGHLKRMIGALGETLRQHEAAHGALTAGGSSTTTAPPPIRFAPPDPKPAGEPAAAPAAPAAASPAPQAAERIPAAAGPQQIPTAMSEKVAPGVYANQMMIRHSREEFLLDFVNVFPPESVVTGRVFVSPEQAKRMLGALRDNFRRYEATHGTIVEAIVPQPGSLIN